MKTTLDPGFGENYDRKAKRIINPDGSFNVVRRWNGRPIKALYQYMINTSWPEFFAWLLTTYTIVNLIFAGLYLLIGSDSLMIPDGLAPLHPFWRAFFFSAQTLTTVGYGHIAPSGLLMGLLSSAEALAGLLMFALLTGLFYGRFANPQAKLHFSKNALIVNKDGKKSLMFRMANRKPSMLLEIEANVMVSLGEMRREGFHRTYAALPLERSKVSFMPLNWTIVHPIDENSPLYELDFQNLDDGQLEILVLIKAFDDSYSQQVHARYSYTAKDLLINASFKKAYFIDDSGNAVLDLEALDLLQ